MTTTYALDVKPRSLVSAQRSTCCCVPCVDSPWGAPSDEGAEPTPQAIRRRKEAVARLLPPLKALVGRLHEVVLDGGLGGDEHALLQSLQVWVGQLIAEQEAPPARREAPRRTRRK